MRFAVSVVALAAASFALRAAFPIQALGYATHDDFLFVRLAEYLRAGQWLGPYDELTLAKGAGFPLFMAATSLLGVPLKVAEHAVYLAASLAFSLAAGRLLGARAASLVIFGVLAFNPVFWDASVGGRVIRENLYVSLGLGLVALALVLFVDEKARPLNEQIRAKRWGLVGLGVLAAGFWITREEGVWLAPALFLLAGGWLWRHRRPAGGGARRHAAALAVFLGIPVAVFAGLVGAVNAINYVHYGVFINNDFRAHHFPAAYGALARIEHERWRPYVVFPADARRKAYEVSPAARALEPWLDGPRGEIWRRIGSEQTQTADCPEILSGWFMWALREAIHGAGHDTARKARTFQRSLAREINEACDRAVIPCGPPGASLVPRWRAEYATPLAKATADVTRTLLTLDKVGPELRRSAGPKPALLRIDRLTGGPLASEDSPGTSPAVARKIAAWQSQALAILFPLGVAGWIGLIAWSAVRRRWHAGHLVVAVLLVAVATRVVLLAFLEATSIPSNNLLYLSPAVPMALALAPCVLFLAIAMFREQPIA